jgi:DNA polymerase (family 10)
VRRAELAGALRRCSDSVDEIVVVVAADDAAGVLDAGTRHPASGRIHERNAAEGAFELADGVRVRIAVARSDRFADLWVRHTGSPRHVARLGDLARARGVCWGPEGLAADSEADVYRRLGLPFIPPELREGQGEIEAALCGRLPAQLVQVDDVRGAIHCHTVHSDGRNTIEEMARAAEAAGMEYLTVTDHSASAGYAGGLTADRLRAQWDEIAEVQQRVNVTLLRGTESDILADGALDFPDPILEQLDVVIASIHQRHRMGPEEMTRRLVAAMRHPCFKIWGHPLGRYVRGRPPIACDMRAVLDAAAESRVAIEVNGDPNRLDAEAHWQQEARVRGIPLVISTDAHSVRGLANLRFGVALARRGWTQRHEVLNTRSCAAFRAAVRPAK